MTRQNKPKAKTGRTYSARKNRYGNYDLGYVEGRVRTEVFGNIPRDLTLRFLRQLEQAGWKVINRHLT